MSESDDKPSPRQPWQPLTPRGVAAFAYATFTRLLLVQLATAMLVACAALAVAALQWFPVVEQAIHNAPAETAIRDGVLISGKSGPQRLAGNRALEIFVDPNHEGGSGGSADVTVILTEKKVLLCGVLGCAALPYLRGYDVMLEREVTEPWWGAWRKAIAAAVVIGVVILSIAWWWIAAACLAPLLKLAAFFLDRFLSPGGSCRLAAAALLPGSSLLIMGFILYAFEAIDLARLALFFGVNVVCGLSFAALTPLLLDRITPRRRNPFNAQSSGGRKKKAARPNPFNKD